MSFIPKIIFNFNQYSLAYKYRKKRFNFFLKVIENLAKPIKILDVGGTEWFWGKMGLCNAKDIKIVLLNTTKQKVICSNIKSKIGDGRNMKGFKSKEFDVVFSNSVLEHVGNYSDQKEMAREIERVGKRYFVETPNKYFPFDPHFHLPFWELYPRKLKILLLSRFNLGWYRKIPDVLEAEKVVDSIRLLDESDLKKLFPQANLIKEYFFGIIKSFILYKN